MTKEKVIDEIIDPCLVSTKMDSLFCKVQGLTWYPWIGSDYEKANRKILIVGESHYNYGYSKEEVEKYNAETMADVLRTRKVIQFYPVKAKNRNITYENIHRILFSSAGIERENFWKSVAFYNFVQRPLDYSNKAKPERPNAHDIESGWQVFREVVEIIKPTDCIFIGVMAADFIPGVERVKLPNCRANVAREFYFSTQTGESIKCSAVRHTSRPFGTRHWHAYLEQAQEEMMDYLKSGSTTFFKKK